MFMPTIRIALVQFDAVPEAVEDNRRKMCDWVIAAVRSGARWIMFHEGAVCDYTSRLAELAEPVPEGPTTQLMAGLAAQHDCFISFGLSESDADRYFITQAFVGPRGLVHRYRKTWLWHDPPDDGCRDEWLRYDPGAGPELFEIDGLRATCFICADGAAARCIDRAAALNPQVVFYPNNRAALPTADAFTATAEKIAAPVLITNRTGASWQHQCNGGCLILSATGDVIAQANRDGKEELLIHDLQL